MQVLAIQTYEPFVDFNHISRQSNDTFDIALGRIVGKPEDYYVTSIDFWRPAILVIVNELINKDSLAVVQSRQHRSSFNFDGLHYKNNHQCREHQREDKVAQQQSTFRPQVSSRRVMGRVDLNVLVVFNLDIAERRRAMLLESKHIPNQSEPLTSVLANRG